MFDSQGTTYFIPPKCLGMVEYFLVVIPAFLRYVGYFKAKGEGERGRESERERVRERESERERVRE